MNNEYNPLITGQPMFVTKLPKFMERSEIEDAAAKTLKRCKMTTVNKSDMPQVVPPEFSINDLKSRNCKAIQELRCLRG